MHDEQGPVGYLRGTSGSRDVNASLVSLQFIWPSSVAVAIVLGAKDIVTVVCSIVLSKGSEPFM